MLSDVLLLADGRFPTGGHAYAAGVEQAVAVADVCDGATLERYLAGRLATVGVTDAAFAVAAWSRVVAGPEAFHELDHLDAELTARTASPRAREVSRRLGRQMLRVAATVWPHPALDHLASASSATGDGPHQAIASGVVTAVAGGSSHDAARLVMHHLSVSVTTGAVRLLGLDPVLVARTHAHAGPLVDELLQPVDAWADAAPADLPGASGALTEILAEHHATWDARLFVG